MNANVIQFPRPEDDGSGEGARHNELEVIEPTSIQLAGHTPTSRRMVTPRTIRRPTVAGIKTGTARAARATFRRLVFELCQGIWIRLFIVARWLYLGFGSWGVFFPYMFAMRERQREAEKIGTKSRASRVTPDHWMALRWAVFLGLHVAGSIGLGWLAGKWDTGLWICWFVFAPIIITMMVWGALHDQKGGPALPTPRRRENVTVESMNSVLRAVRVLKEPTTQTPNPGRVRLAAPPRTVGAGQLVVWDLDETTGKAFLDVLPHHARIAGAFATSEDCFVMLPGSHPGQFKTWQAPKDPFAGPFRTHPLMAHERWNVFEPVPFAHNAMGEWAYTPLVYTGFMTSAMPRKGKTFAARSILVGAVLDPIVKFHVFDGKPGQTWVSLKGMAEDFVNGAGEDQCRQVAEALERLKAQMEEIGPRIPGSKITESSARTRGIPVRVILLDEVHRYFDSRGYGKKIREALEDIAKVGPSFGYVPFTITQRPDSETFTTSIRNVLPVRLVLKVDTGPDSNMAIGGSNLTSMGIDASKIKHRGVAWFRPDMDADGRLDADESVRLVRIFDMSDDQWITACRVGYMLRDQNPDLAEPPDPEGEAIAAELVEDEELSTTDLLARIAEHAPDAMPEGVHDTQTLGNWLAGAGVRPTGRQDRFGRNRRSRAEVERALGVLAGSLTGPDSQDPDDPARTPQDPRQDP